MLKKFKEGICKYCSITFRKIQNHQKYCSVSCRNKYRSKNRIRKPLNKEQKERYNRLRKKRRREQAIKNLITKKCGMCGKEVPYRKIRESRICGKKCKEDYNKYIS
jgi:hypothetical protein